MSFYDHLEVLFDESSFMEAGALLLFVLAFYFVIFRKRFGSIFDPLVYVLTFSALSTTFLLLLALHGLVSPQKLVFVIAVLGLFYMGFLVTDKSSARIRVGNRTAHSPFQLVQPATLAVLFAANFLVLTITYIFFGVPLFLESRLAQFAGSGGFGILGRISTGLEFTTLVLAFLAIGQRRSAGRWAKAILIQFVISAVLSGSKGSLLTGLFAWCLSHLYRKPEWSDGPRLPRLVLAILPIAVLFPLFVISVQNPEDLLGLDGVVARFAIRFAAEGDAYSYFLGNNLIDSVARHDLIAPLRPVLAAFRLVPAETLVNPGFEIVRELLGVDNPSAGPNSRLAIYLLYFYGYGGIVFAPILGAALGYSRNRLVRVRWSSPMGFALAAAVYFQCCRLEVDPQLTIAGLFGLGLALPIFWIAVAIARGATPRPKPGVLDATANRARAPDLGPIRGLGLPAARVKPR